MIVYGYMAGSNFSITSETHKLVLPRHNSRVERFEMSRYTGNRKRASIELNSRSKYDIKPMDESPQQSGPLWVSVMLRALVPIEHASCSDVPKFKDAWIITII